MPNHVVNELIFTSVDAQTVAMLKAQILGDIGQVDFEVLLPSPLNIWKFGVQAKHETTFPNTYLDWASDNWGTKWNAYGKQEFEVDGDTLTIIFDTAWSPPYGWLVALFNLTKLSFQHNWLSEGEDRGHSGRWSWPRPGDRELFINPWNETPADDLLHLHLHKLRWGVESFDRE